MCYSSEEDEEGLSSWKKKDVERKKELERKTKEMEERFVWTMSITCSLALLRNLFTEPIFLFSHRQFHVSTHCISDTICQVNQPYLIAVTKTTVTLHFYIVKKSLFKKHSMRITQNRK